MPDNVFISDTGPLAIYVAPAGTAGHSLRSNTAIPGAWTPLGDPGAIQGQIRINMSEQAQTVRDSRWPEPFDEFITGAALSYSVTIQDMRLETVAAGLGFLTVSEEAATGSNYGVKTLNLNKTLGLRAKRAIQVFWRPSLYYDQAAVEVSGSTVYLGMRIWSPQVTSGGGLSLAPGPNGAAAVTLTFNALRRSASQAVGEIKMRSAATT